MIILYAIVVLGVLIFVHELGHFLVAKSFNVKIEKFSLGFGPKLLSKKIGETEYILSALPLGGYVKMFGETGIIEGNTKELTNTESMQGRALTEEEKTRSFSNKPLLTKMAIVFAGPLFNLVFAWLVFIFLCMLGIPSVTPKIGEVLKDKPAARAGVLKNDLITLINDKAITRWDDVATSISANKEKPLALTVKRDQTEIKFTITPEPRVSKNIFGENVNSFGIGIAAAGEIVTEQFSIDQAIIKGTQQTGTVIKITVMSLVKLVQRTVPLDSLGGPIMIAKMAGETAQAGGASFLAFMALLSINLGVLNLLPVPVLDGGHLFFYLWELLFRRPVSQKAREYAQQVGIVLLIGLMVVAFYNDIARFFFKHGG